MKPADVKSNSYVEYNVDSNAKHAKFKTGDHVRISNYKNIFAKRYALNWYEEVFLIGKVNCTMDICYWIIWEEKEICYMLNWKAVIICLIAGLIKKTLHKISQYFPKPYEPFGRNINIKVVSKYATKTDLKKLQE